MMDYVSRKNVYSMVKYVVDVVVYEGHPYEDKYAVKMLSKRLVKGSYKLIHNNKWSGSIK